MTKRETKFLLEGDLAAKVEVDLIESDDPWAPYLSAEEAKKLDQVRLALRRGDVEEALKFGRVYRMTPITAP